MGKSIKIITILTMVLLINSCSINTKTVDDKNTDVVSNFIEPVNDTSNNYYENVKYYGAITKSISNEIIPIEMTITFTETGVTGYYNKNQKKTDFEGVFDEDNILEAKSDNGETFVAMINNNDIYGVWGDSDEWGYYDEFRITKELEFSKPEVENTRCTLYSSLERGYTLTIAREWLDYCTYYDYEDGVGIYYYTDKYAGPYMYEGGELEDRKGYFMYIVIKESDLINSDYDFYGELGEVRGINYIKAGSTGVQKMVGDEKYRKILAVMEMGLDIQISALNTDNEKLVYILPKSNSEFLTEDDINNLSSNDIRFAINEIYARHGLIFNEDEYKNYFNNRYWYEEKITSNEFDVNVFNEYERENLALLLEYEDKQK